LIVNDEKSEDGRFAVQPKVYSIYIKATARYGENNIPYRAFMLENQHD
jgi:hypothetical protein